MAVLEALLHTESVKLPEKVGHWLPVRDWPLLELPLRLTEGLDVAVTQTVAVEEELSEPLAATLPEDEGLAMAVLLSVLAEGLGDPLRVTELQPELDGKPELLHDWVMQADTVTVGVPLTHTVPLTLTIADRLLATVMV